MNDRLELIVRRYIKVDKGRQMHNHAIQTRIKRQYTILIVFMTSPMGTTLMQLPTISNPKALMVPCPSIWADMQYDRLRNRRLVATGPTSAHTHTHALQHD